MTVDNCARAADKPFRGGTRECRPPPPRVMRAWDSLIIHLDDAAQMAAQSFADPSWGRPIAASAWATSEEGYLRMFCADFANGRRLIRRHSSGRWQVTLTRTPTLAQPLAPNLSSKDLTNG